MLCDKIKLLAMDVDGTLTDGQLYITGKGELYKVFNVKDGMGIKIAKENGIITAIITGRKSDIVDYRAKELGIDITYQAVVDKVTALETIIGKYGLSFGSVAYVGDDINDIPVMKKVGLSFSPSDAAPEVLKTTNIVLNSKGGHGAVRECVEYILDYNKKASTD